MQPQEERVRTFILKLWFEPTASEGATGEWRGEMRDVPGGTINYFRTIQGMGELLHRLLDRRPDEPE